MFKDWSIRSVLIGSDLSKELTVLDAIGTPLILRNFGKGSWSTVQQLVNDAVLFLFLQVLKGVLRSISDPLHGSNTEGRNHLNYKGPGLVTSQRGPFSLQRLVDTDIIISTRMERER